MKWNFLNGLAAVVIKHTKTQPPNQEQHFTIIRQHTKLYHKLWLVLNINSFTCTLEYKVESVMEVSSNTHHYMTNCWCHHILSLNQLHFLAEQNRLCLCSEQVMNLSHKKTLLIFTVVISPWILDKFLNCRVRQRWHIIKNFTEILSAVVWSSENENVIQPSDSY